VPLDPPRLDTPQDRRTRATGGRRSRTLSSRKRGRYIRARPSNRPTDLAFDATLRASAPYQQERREEREEADEEEGPALDLRPQDYREKVRVRRAANLILFVVDASWSMAVSERMEATKGAVLSLLTDAYQQRDRVGLIVFQKDRSTLVLPPTNSVELAKQRLADLPVGGKTPLSAGLWQALQTIQQETRRSPDLRPLLILLTDGAGNVSMGDMPPQLEAYHIAEQIQAAGIQSIVVNMESQTYDEGYADALAEHLGGICHTLDSLQATRLLHMVRQELNS
jgi:Mg-chelatase subunit ChlD